MKKATLFLLCGALFLGTGCETMNHIMTYHSPANITVEESDKIFGKLRVASNVFDGAVIVRSGMTDEVTFDEKSQVYDFETGRSVFRTYNLPLNATNLRIDISVQIGETVFAPTVALLNKERKLIKMFDFNSFEYRPYNDVVAESLKFRFTLNNFSAGDNAVAYMVIFTKDQDLKTSTQVVHPAKLFAKSHREEIPDIADPLIPHSRLGVVTVNFSMDAGDIDSVSDFLDALKGPIWGGENHQYIADDDDGSVVRPGSSTQSGMRAVNPVGDQHASGTATAPRAATSAAAAPAAQTRAAAPRAAPGTMMKETETMYNGMIESAVKAGNVSKAMQLAEEAVNAGSATANDTLNRALRNYGRSGK